MAFDAILNMSKSVISRKMILFCRFCLIFLWSSEYKKISRTLYW